MVLGYEIFGYDESESGIAYVGVLADPEENGYNRKFSNLEKSWKNGGILTKVFLTIYAAQEKQDRVWFRKMFKLIYGKDYQETDRYEVRKIIKSLKFLEDYFIIEGEYGETEKGKIGRLYLINEEGVAPFILKEVLEKGVTVEKYFLEYYKMFRDKEDVERFKEYLECNFDVKL